MFKKSEVKATKQEKIETFSAIREDGIWCVQIHGKGLQRGFIGYDVNPQLAARSAEIAKAEYEKRNGVAA